MRSPSSEGTGHLVAVLGRKHASARLAQGPDVGQALKPVSGAESMHAAAPDSTAKLGRKWGYVLCIRGTATLMIQIPPAARRSAPPTTRSWSFPAKPAATETDVFSDIDD